MKRPLLWAFGASILGEILAYQYPEAGVAWLAAGVCLSVVLFVCVRRAGRWLLLPVFFLIGFGGMLRADRISPLRFLLEEAAEPVRGEIAGRVRDIRCSAGGFKIHLTDIRFLTSEGRVIEGQGLLLYVDTFPEAEPGDRILAKGEGRALEKASNPGQFDSRSYYRAFYIEGIFFPESLSVTAVRTNGVMKWLYRIRMGGTAVLDRIGELAPSGGWRDTMGLLCGVLLGEKSRIPEEVSKALSAGGLSHMAAVSGLHISLIGMNVFRFLKKKAVVSYPASVLGSVLLVAGYGTVVGTTASSVRAVVGFVLFLFGEMADRPYDLPSAFSAAGLFLLMKSPYLLFQAGFQLSFLAVAGIGLIHPVLRDRYRPGPLENAFLLNLSVQIATLPAVVGHFYEYPAPGLFLNLLLVPMLPLVVGVGMAGLLVGCISLKGGALLFMPVHFLLQIFCRAGRWASNLPGGQIRTGRPFLTGLVCFGLFWLLALFVLWKRAERRRKERKRWDGRLLLLFLFVFSLSFLRRPAPKELTITCLDVGQGDCLFLQFPSGKTMLIDGGSSDVRDVGEYRILPFLKYMGIFRVDYLAVTHMDEDHTNGVSGLLTGNEVCVGEILISGVSGGKEEERRQWKDEAAEHGIRCRELTAGMGLQDKSGAEVICCYPAAGSRVEEENDASLVFFLRYGDFGALFTGDLGEEREKEVLAFLPGTSLTFLKAAHHGSRYSTGEEFLKRQRPEWAVISCGEKNRYGHPHEETLARLSAIGCEVRVTSREGAVSFLTDGENVRLRTFGK